MPLVSKISDYLKRKKTLKEIQKLITNQDIIKLEIGAGEKRINKGWTTLDMRSTKSDIDWDLRMGVPFPDNTVQAIYSSHVFEHFSYQHIRKLLKECYRVLKPEGTFSIVVPNSGFYVSAYLNNTNVSEIGGDIYKPAFHETTRIDYLNYVGHMNGDHKYMFDEENLIFLLKDTGFRVVNLRDFDASMDKEFRDFESIYALAKK